MFQWDLALPSQYNTLYATALGINPLELGFWNSVGRALNSLVSIPAGWVSDKYGLKSAILLGLGFFFFGALCYSFAFDAMTVVPAIVLGSVTIVYPFSDIAIINYSKPWQRTMIMAFTRTIWAIPSIFIPLAAAAIVTSFGGININGIKPLYYLQVFFALLVFFFMFVKLKTSTIQQAENEGNLKTERSIIRDFHEIFQGEKHLKKWIVIQTTFFICQFFSVAFTPLWMVNVIHADPYVMAISSMAGIVVLILLQMPVGQLADRIGRKKAFFLFRPFTYLGTLLLIFAPSPEYLILVGFIGAFGVVGAGGMGGIGGAGFIPFITMNFEMVSAEKRGRWNSVTSVFNIISFPVSVLAGFLWEQGFMKEVLLIPVLLELLVTLPLLTTVPDTLKQASQ